MLHIVNIETYTLFCFITNQVPLRKFYTSFQTCEKVVNFCVCLFNRWPLIIMAMLVVSTQSYTCGVMDVWKGCRKIRLRSNLIYI